MLNPAKQDGDAPVSVEAARKHAEKYAHLVFFNTDRADHNNALQFYRTEQDVLESAQNALTTEPDVVEEPDVQVNPVQQEIAV